MKELGHRIVARFGNRVLVGGIEKWQLLQIVIMRMMHGEEK